MPQNSGPQCSTDTSLQYKAGMFGAVEGRTPSPEAAIADHGNDGRLGGIDFPGGKCCKQEQANLYGCCGGHQQGEG